MWCVFSQGKDVRVNLEYNLTMANVLGHTGWLYNETKALHEEGAILSCSGDSPFQLRLLKGVSSDVSCLSKMCLYSLILPFCRKLSQSSNRKRTVKHTRRRKKGWVRFFLPRLIISLGDELCCLLISTNKFQKNRLSF